MPKSILDLPPEVLGRIPGHLDDLHSYLALTETCHYIHDALSSPSPGDLLQLAFRTSGWASPPLPLLTLLGCGISEYAGSSETRRVAAKRAIWDGASDFLEWAVHTPAIAANAKISTGSLRRYVKDEEDLWDPLTDLVDRNIGNQWYDIADFWDGGRSDAYTIGAECELVPSQLALWGELFGKGFGDWLETAARAASDRKLAAAATPRTGKEVQWDPNYPPPIAWCCPSVRTDFLKYTYLGWLVSLGIRSPPRPNASQYDGPNVSAYPPSPTDFWTGMDRKPFHHPLKEVQAVRGPYAAQLDHLRPEDDHKALSALIGGSCLWGRITQRIRDRCGGDFGVPVGRRDDGEESWKQDIWENCLYALGIEGMRMIRDMWEAMRDDEDDREKARQLVMKMPESERPPEWRDSLRLQRRPIGELKEKGAGWEKLRSWHELIAALDKEPRRITLNDGRHDTGMSYEFPYLIGDIDLIMMV